MTESVETSDTLSLTVLELSYVVIVGVCAASSCFVGVVTVEIVKDTTVSCAIAFDPIANFTLRPSIVTVGEADTTGLSVDGCSKVNVVLPATTQPACTDVTSGSTT
jgi:hypothetical protein